MNQAHCWVLRVQASASAESETSDLVNASVSETGSRDRPFLENFTVDASI
jgi:hypothetical protein